MIEWDVVSVLVAEFERLLQKLIFLQIVADGALF